jgi:hypothetical protein
MTEESIRGKVVKTANKIVEFISDSDNDQEAEENRGLIFPPYICWRGTGISLQLSESEDETALLASQLGASVAKAKEDANKQKRKNRSEEASIEVSTKKQARQFLSHFIW